MFTDGLKLGQKIGSFINEICQDRHIQPPAWRAPLHPLGGAVELGINLTTVKKALNFNFLSIFS